MNEQERLKKEQLEPKILLICQSVHHGNTMKIAKVIGEELNAEIMKPSDITENDLSAYDLIGFGSGIYNSKHHVSLFRLIEKFEKMENRKAFIFSTASVKYIKMHEALTEVLTEKGFEIIDEFICRGFMNYSFTKYIFGGINKKRPNKNDISDAKAFAMNIKKKL